MTFYEKSDELVYAVTEAQESEDTDNAKVKTSPIWNLKQVYRPFHKRI